MADDWGKNDSIVQAAATSWGGSDSVVPAAARTRAPSTIDVLAPAIGPMGVVTGGPLVHLTKPLLPKEWQDYITGVQRAAFQGATMNFGDEALAGIGSATGQGTYDELLARERAAGKEFREENPVGSMVGELGGALTGAASVPLGSLGRTSIQAAAKGAPLIEKAGRMGARLLERALKGAGAGAAFGFGSGYGEGEGDADQRLAAATQGAQTGAMLGAGLNAGLPAAAYGAGKLVDLGRGAARALAGPQTQAAQQAAAGEVIEKLGQKSGKDLLTDLATGQSTAPKVADVPIPAANIMDNPGLQAATRAELRRDPGAAVTLREGREAGARNLLDDLRPDGAPIAARTELEAQNAARRAALEVAEAEQQAAVREAQDAARAQRFQAQEGVREAIGDARTLGRGAVEDARAAGSQRLRELEASLEDQMATLRAQGLSDIEAAHVAATDALMTTGMFPDKAAASRAAREAIEAELAARKATGSRLYEAVPEGTRLPLNPLHDTITGIHTEAYRTGRMDALPEILTSGKIIDFLQNATPQRLEGLRGSLSEALSRARQAGERQRARYLQQMIDGVDNTMNAASEGAAAGGASLTGVPELQAARTYWRDNVARPFYRGAVADILKVGDDGLPRIEPTRALGAVVKPTSRGGTEAIDQFVQAAGGRENALAAATEWAIADAAEYAVGRNGRIDLPKLNRWMRERTPALDALPGLRERLGGVRELAERAEAAAVDHTATVQRAQADAQEAIRQAREAMQARVDAARSQGADAVREVAARGREVMRQVEQRATESVRAARDSQAARVEAARRSVDEIQKSAAKMFLGADPMVAARGIMNSADPAKAYFQVQERLRGNHEALAGLKRSLFDALEAELGGFATVDTGVRQGTRDLIASNTPLLRAVFGRRQADQATELLRALEASKAHVGVPGNVGSATAAHLDQGALTETLLEHAVGKMSRLPVMNILLNNLRTSANESVRGLIKEALFDPEKMRVLLETRVTRQNAPSVAKRLSEWMERRTMEGIPVRAMGDARDQERMRRDGRATGGRAGYDVGGALDQFGGLLRSLRATDTTAGDPHGPAPSLVPNNPYPIYYLPGQYGGQGGGQGGASGVAAPITPFSGFSGVSGPAYGPVDILGGLGGPGPAGGSTGAPSGPTQGVNAGVTAQSVGNAVASAVSPVPGLVSIANMIAAIANPHSTISVPGVATVDVNEPNSNVNDTLAAIESQTNNAVAAGVATGNNAGQPGQANAPGQAANVGPTPGIGMASPTSVSQDPPGVQGTDPGSGGAGVGSGGGDPNSPGDSTDSGTWKRGGAVATARRVSRQNKTRRYAVGRR